MLEAGCGGGEGRDWVASARMCAGVDSFRRVAGGPLVLLPETVQLGVCGHRARGKL